MNNKLPESLKLIPLSRDLSSWWEHVPIAHWLVEKLKPQVIVELGTHNGVSFSSFCEAAEQYSRDTYVYAIDTWEGDKQAGYYTDDVYQKVVNMQREHYARCSTLIRSTFDEASKYFENGSIDILHIDGLHTYEAVKNDYTTWKSKVRRGGTILFHDWNVRERGFGVYKLWDEIKKEQGVCFTEIKNGYGLGVLTISEEKPTWHNELVENLEYLQMKGILLSELNDLRQRLDNTKQKESELINIQISTKEEYERMARHCKEQNELINSLRENWLKTLIRITKRIKKKLGQTTKRLSN